ncbi:MAG: transcription antitermination protein NusB [Bacteroidales bacterium]|nr:transcription antitermination protein NusB [Bacteroidales bacterium]
MLSRRLIRVKVFKILFGRIIAGSDSLVGAENELIASCEKTLDLYCFMLQLPVALKRVAESKIETGLKKFKPTAEEANPNRKFVENRFIEIIENDPKFTKYRESHGLLWADYESFVKKLYSAISASEYFVEYMANPDRSLKEDCALFKKIFEQELEDNENLEDILEELSLFWMDDLGYVLGVILKNINAMAKSASVIIPDVFRNEDDKAYAKKLLTQSLVKYDEYTKLIADFVSNWDMERLVATDLALIVMGITEAVTFETIPLKVTINEFVDISKYYSTANSRIFVNGLLDRMLQKMYKEGTIVKSGRGLVGSAE